ncbi:MAG: patatin-like phospholipase family protein, partial [Candidatus Binatia bacterium]
MRSLILAGGGVKVGFQAGVLQVWLDEAGLTFDHADGASGGCLNLAMYCQGLSGREIAENWKKAEPLAGVDLNWEHYWKLVNAPSLFTLDRYRKNVMREAWKLDWAKIRSSQRLGTFNVCNFSKHRLEVIPNGKMTEDYLAACISLPMWFPPVVIDGETHVDAVYLTDANVEEAIRRGADEIWAIWTVSTDSTWRDGFVAQYFHIIEIAANGRFFDIWRRIEKSNDEIAAGRPGELGRRIELRLLQAEVPIHYLINFSKDRMAESVNLGIETAREWCDRNGIPLPHRGAAVAAPRPAAASRLEFTEEMKGYVTPGETEFAKGKKHEDRAACMFHLTIEIDDVDTFVTSPRHEARPNGWVELAPLGGRRPVTGGRFNLLVDDADPKRKKMLYRLFFSDAAGKPFTLSGHKD